jgi:hypothetical protein
MKDKLISLNVLRGVAAMLVVLYHMEVLQVSFITRLFTWGWIGVDIFFVLSGLFIGISVIKSKPLGYIKIPQTSLFENSASLLFFDARACGVGICLF